ncbi:hypothetical protein DIPPA_33895 [Diplonema papillatum]|nr:hypothetical protein DIPPA_33895 [Diplonema papillatum]
MNSPNSPPRAVIDRSQPTQAQCLDGRWVGGSVASSVCDKSDTPVRPLTHAAGAASYFALYEGQHGVDCADFLRRQLHVHLLDTLRSDPAEENELSDRIVLISPPAPDFALSTDNPLRLHDLCKRAFAGVDALYLRAPRARSAHAAGSSSRLMFTERRAEEAGRPRPDGRGESGAYAAAALVCDGTAAVCTVGPVRVVLCRGGCAVPLAAHPSPASPREKKRIQAAGGFVSYSARVGLICEGTPGHSNSAALLSSSRGFGFAPFKAVEGLSPEEQPVVASPATTLFGLLEADEFLLMATDAVCSARTDAELVAFFREGLAQNRHVGDLADEVVRSVLERPSTPVSSGEKGVGVVCVTFEAPAPGGAGPAALHTSSVRLLEQWRQLADEGRLPGAPCLQLIRDAGTSPGSPKGGGLAPSSPRLRALEAGGDGAKPALKARVGNPLVATAGDDGSLRDSDQAASPVASSFGGGPKDQPDGGRYGWFRAFSVSSPRRRGGAAYWAPAAGCGAVGLAACGGWSAARGDPGPAGLAAGALAAALAGGYLYLASGAGDDKPAAAGAFARPAGLLAELLLAAAGLVVSVGYDVASGGAFDFWVLSFGVLFGVACLPGTRFSTVAAVALAVVVWQVLRSVEEAEPYGLFAALPQMSLSPAAVPAAAPRGKGGRWLAEALASRVLGVLFAVYGCFAARWRLGRSRAAAKATLDCVTELARMLIERDMADGGVQQLLQKAGAADGSGQLTRAAFQIIARVEAEKRRRNRGRSADTDLSELAQDRDNVSICSDLSNSCPTPADPFLAPAGGRAQPRSPLISRHVSALSGTLPQDHAGNAATFGEVVAGALRTSHGTLLHFSGNSVLAAWGMDSSTASHGTQAVAAAVFMQNQLAGRSFYAGIASGPVSVVREKTEGLDAPDGPLPIGLCVSIVGHLSGYARAVKAKIVLTDKVYELVRSQIVARPIDSVVLYERGRAEVLYEYQGIRSENSKNSDQRYTEAFSALQQLRLDESKRNFEQVLDTNPRDRQARRLLSIVEWLVDTDCAYVGNARMYSRRLMGELEHMCCDKAVDDEILSPRRGSVSADPDVNSVFVIHNNKRESLQHDKVLRRQIRDAEAEAHAADLVAWGVMPDTGKPISAVKRKKDVPTRFTDHKSQVWCRSYRSIGTGAFGEVWLGMGSDGSLVAMKSMSLPTRTDVLTNASSTQGMSAAARRRLQRRAGAANAPNEMQQIEDLLREVSLMHKLRHDNIVSYMASAVVDGYIMIVMEYLSGGSLHDMLVNFSSAALPLTSIQRYVQDIVRGLEFLHSRDIIHRDMKSQNVLLLVDGQCKLADFGASASLSQMAKTNQGVIGTPLYMAPEAAAGSACKASDIWALGIILCEMLTGVVPYNFSEEEPFNPHSFLFRLGNFSDFGPSIPQTIQPDARAMASAVLRRDPLDRPTATELMTHAFLIA